MSACRPLTIADLVPGGVLRTDHIHHRVNDGTCSRCRVFVAESQVPLMLFFGEGEEHLLIYCPACLGDEPPASEGDINADDGEREAR